MTDDSTFKAVSKLFDPLSPLALPTEPTGHIDDTHIDHDA
jgi:hypothetical protein